MKAFTDKNFYWKKSKNSTVALITKALSPMTNIDISTDKSKLDTEYIHIVLRSSYWAQNIPKDLVIKSIKNSMCFGMYKNGRQIGFTRVITDYVTFAYLADVFIDPAQQNRGYGKLLISNVLDHAELKDIKRWHLVTKDAHSFYRDLRFLQVSKNEGHMKKYKKPAYKIS